MFKEKQSEEISKWALMLWRGGNEGKGDWTCPGGMCWSLESAGAALIVLSKTWGQASVASDCTYRIKTISKVR